MIQISDIKERLLYRLRNEKQLAGIQSQYFNFFNKTSAGLRMGEFSLVTGATGSGKTTFLSQLSLDFLAQGVPTLWGSFEIQNEIFAETMVKQLSMTTPKNEAQAVEAIEKLEQLPLHLLNFYGSTQPEEIFETLEYSIIAHDISIMCLDNLQFMLSEQAYGYNKFDLQDTVVSKLRQLATRHNVHIFLVVHPKKVEDDRHLNSSSIYGSSKITQEADNVFILQKSPDDVPNYRKLQLVKNRFNGVTDETALAFNPDSRRYFEMHYMEAKAFSENNGDIRKLMDSRKERFGTVEPTLEEFEQMRMQKNLTQLRTD